MMLVGSPTLAWLARAADDPVARHPSHLPEFLDFREHSPLFRRVYQSAPAGTELGFPIVLQGGELEFPAELTASARYQPFVQGGRFVGTFHVHPLATAVAAPFFDPGDLAGALRSDNAGFVELLLAGERLYALVRANPYLYISAHHVNRNPLLLQESHAAMLRRAGARQPTDPGYAERYRRASLYYFHRYQLALYEGDPSEPLKRTVTPEARW
jgi:hypothetical protein